MIKSTGNVYFLITHTVLYYKYFIYVLYSFNLALLSHNSQQGPIEMMVLATTTTTTVIDIKSPTKVALLQYSIYCISRVGILMETMI